MFEEMITIKGKVRAKKKTLTDLSRSLGMNYDKLGHYLAGRRKMPDGLEDQIDEIIESW